MRVLVLGAGGREHAMAWKLAQSSSCHKVIVAPGNDGIRNSGIEVFDFKNLNELKIAVQERKIDLIIPGSEKYLAEGIASFDFGCNVKVFGPTSELAKLETSKSFAKEILIEAKIPTAKYFAADSELEALEVLKSNDWTGGVVIKFDGLAAGKGVVVCDDSESGKSAVSQLAREYGETFVIEERLSGPEFSAFAIVHENSFLSFGSACDYKRRSEDLNSPNTGGMGAYSPCEWANILEVEELVWKPLFKTLSSKKLSYSGFIYVGLMKTDKGIKVIEFNVRLGDPETQALLPLMKNDFLEIILSQGKIKPQFTHFETAVHVVLTHPLYPQLSLDPLQLSDKIFSKNEHCLKFFSAVIETAQGWKTAGGRIFGITSHGADKIEARSRVYKEIELSKFESLSFRKDIGL